MTDTQRRKGTPTPVSAGIDALRRRPQPPGWPDVSCALDELTVSVDPSVALASLARLSVSIGLADGCELELTDGDRPPFRTSAGNAGAEPASGGPDVPRMLVTPLHCPSRGRFASFSGVLVHWWHSHQPDEKDRLLVDLLARHAISVVDRQRLVEMIAGREERSSQLAMQAIIGRWIDIATGLIMSQFEVDVDDAEEMLRDTARHRRVTAWDLALEVVRARGLLDRPTPATTTTPVHSPAATRHGRRLRPVRPDDD